MSNPQHILRETRRHYESYPFIEGGEKRAELWSRRLTKVTGSGPVAGLRVLDVGSSSGEVTSSLAQRGAEVYCLDLTLSALQRAADLGRRAFLVQSNALALPFRDGTFDLVISMGVLHHTPDCHQGLREIGRVSRRGAHIGILLYSRRTPYHLAYLLTRPLRRRVPVEALENTPRILLILFRPILRVLTGQSLSDEQIRRMLADQFWTPRATFHSRREVEDWCGQTGLHVNDVLVYYGYSRLYILRKQS